MMRILSMKRKIRGIVFLFVLRTYVGETNVFFALAILLVLPK